MSSKYDISDFQLEVTEKSNQIPVLVDFWANWCQPCKILGPILEELADQNSDQFVLAKVNTEELTEVAREFKIQSIPAVKLFIDGKAVAEFTGALPKAHIEKWLKENIPSEDEKELEDIKNQIQAGIGENAEQRLTTLIAKAPGLNEARIILASFYIFSEPSKAIELVKDILEDSPLFQTVNAMKTYYHFISVQEIDPPTNQPNLNEKLMSAIINAKNKNFNETMPDLIYIVQVNKGFHDEIARKTCIALFHLLGTDHEVTKKYRRRFDMALY